MHAPCDFCLKKTTRQVLGPHPWPSPPDEVIFVFETMVFKAQNRTLQALSLKTMQMHWFKFLSHLNHLVETLSALKFSCLHCNFATLTFSSSIRNQCQICYIFFKCH